ncbi:Stf0 family sulfotransferase [Pseudoalteromonas carrageenovora]|uniref:Stf0 family sulfotransferase n=1 Tax=Pseudoalteromonas carrageenovora TaxID=227 RepID=UPI00311ED9D1
MHLYKEQFLEKHDYPRVSKPSKVLIIASTERCGSHMLGHALHNTNSFGFPLEYANPANLNKWKEKLQIDDFFEVIDELQQRRTSPNGVFGIKLHYQHIEQFGGFENLVKYFPDAYYVLLTRENVLNQAVSLSIASQTGVWISGQEPMTENPEYNYSSIDESLKNIIKNNSSWRYALAASDCNYIEMNFDNVKNNLNNTISQIADFMGISVNSEDIPKEQVTSKQSNKLNEEWADRFCAEFNLSSQLIPEQNPKLIKKIKKKIKETLL